MDTYRAAKELPRPCRPAKKRSQNIPATPLFDTTYALLLGENRQTDEAVKVASTRS